MGHDEEVIREAMRILGSRTTERKLAAIRKVQPLGTAAAARSWTPERRLRHSEAQRRRREREREQKANEGGSDGGAGPS